MIFCNKMGLPFKDRPENLDPSSKMDRNFGCILEEILILKIYEGEEPNKRKLTF